MACSAGVLARADESVLIGLLLQLAREFEPGFQISGLVGVVGERGDQVVVFRHQVGQTLFIQTLRREHHQHDAGREGRGPFRWNSRRASARAP